MADVIRVLLVDDDPLVRAGLAMIIASASDLLIVGEAADGLEAVDSVRAQRPQVVLMDIRMPRPPPGGGWCLSPRRRRSWY
jgi:YesN/AraC family two-component response regulator